MSVKSNCTFAQCVINSLISQNVSAGEKERPSSTPSLHIRAHYGSGFMRSANRMQGSF